jgi:hypothetical protein
MKFPLNQYIKLSLIILTLPAIALSCRRMDQRDSESDERRLLIDLYVVHYMESGYCMHSQKIATGIATLHCYPVSRVNCKPDGLYDPAGLQYTSGKTSSRYASIINKIKEDHPDCSLPADYALLDPAYFPDTEETLETYESNNHYEVVSACPAPGNEESLKIADKSEYKFLISPRGAVAIHATDQGLSQCLYALGISDSERNLIENYIPGNVILRTECTYGPDALIPDCTDEESEYTYPFDF